MKKIILSIIFILIPSVALAAGGGHHEPHISHLKWYWFNFLVYCGILFFLLRKPVAAYWETRWKGLENQINKGERALAQAEQELQVAREKISTLQASISKLKEQVQSETEFEIAAVQEDTQAQVERINKQLAMSMESEQQASMIALQEELAAKVIKQAEEELRNHFNSDNDKDYRGAALASLEAVVATTK